MAQLHAVGHPINRISELMRWVFIPETQRPPPNHGKYRTLTSRGPIGTVLKGVVPS